MSKIILALILGMFVLTPTAAHARANCDWSLVTGGPVLGSVYRHTCCAGSYCCSRDYIDMWIPIGGVSCTDQSARLTDPGASESPSVDTCRDENEPLACMPNDETSDRASE